jgi:6-phosphofructokinase 2
MGILTVTLNPALDLETRTTAWRRGASCAVRGQADRSRRRRYQRGACNPCAGRRGEGRGRGGRSGGHGACGPAARAGLEVAPLPAPGETRQNLSVIEDSTGAQYRFIFPGPEWTADDLSAAQAALLPLVRPGDLVVLSGSVPPGLAPSALKDLARALGCGRRGGGRHLGRPAGRDRGGGAGTEGAAHGHGRGRGTGGP